MRTGAKLEQRKQHMDQLISGHSCNICQTRTMSMGCKYFPIRMCCSLRCIEFLLGLSQHSYSNRHKLSEVFIKCFM